jgi:hypothetical protein
MKSAFIRILLSTTLASSAFAFAAKVAPRHSATLAKITPCPCSRDGHSRDSKPDTSKDDDDNREQFEERQFDRSLLAIYG